jgi:hypothetical protein
MGNMLDGNDDEVKDKLEIIIDTKKDIIFTTYRKEVLREIDIKGDYRIETSESDSSINMKVEFYKLKEDERNNLMYYANWLNIGLRVLFPISNVKNQLTIENKLEENNKPNEYCQTANVYFNLKKIPHGLDYDLIIK